MNVAEPEQHQSVAKQWNTHRAALAQWMMRHMVNRTDCCGAYTPLKVRGTPGTDGKPIPKSYTCKRELTLQRLQQHFSTWAQPEDVIGAQTISLGDTCNCVSLDIDFHSDADNTVAAEMNLRFAMAIYILLDRLGLRPLMWESNGRGGYHLDIIFSEPIPAADAYRFGKWLVRDWKSFGFKSPPESFPKQPTRGEGYGNWLRLPGRHHTNDHWATVYDSESGDWLEGEAAAMAILSHQPVTPAAIPPEAIKAPEPRPQTIAPVNYTGNVTDDIETAVAALNVIPGADDYDIWIRVGQACHGTSTTLLDAWEQWSRSSSKCKDCDCAGKWQTFGKKGGASTGIGTLCMLADQTGLQWRPQRRDDPNVDISGILNGQNGNSVYTVNSVYAPEDWPEPIPLDGGKVAEFPIDAIPIAARGFIEQLAEFTQTPVDLAAGMWMAATSVCLQKRIVVQPVRGWIEPVNLYVLSVMEPANRKSAVVNEIIAPIRRFEAAELERVGPAIRAARSAADVKTKQRNKLVDDAAKAGLSTDRDMLLREVQKLDEEIAANPIPSEPRLLADDITPEHLATKLAQNGERMGVLTAEGDLFDIMAGRYSKGSPNIGIFLKSHSGDEVRVDRGNRPSELIASPALSLGFCVQPEVLRGLMEQKQFRGRGLLGRLLYQIPESLIGRRKIRPDEIQPSVQIGYANLMELLLRFGKRETDKQMFICLSKSANSLFTEYRELIEASLGEFGELRSISDWAGKLPGAVARIAALFHVVENIGSFEIPEHITGETMQSAIQIGKYLTSHATAAFAIMGLDESISLARHFLRVIQKHQWEQFTKRDLHQIVRRHVTAPDDLDTPIKKLIERGYLRLIPQAKDVAGRKPSDRYEVHPKVIAEEI